MTTSRRLLLLAMTFLMPRAGYAAEADNPFAFRDAGKAAGIFPHVAGIHGHAAAWGDVDGDGWPDLYVGTFHKKDGKANLFFRNREGRFAPDPQPLLAVSGRASGSVFADLDNDGDADLFLSNLADTNTDHRGTTSRLFRNDGTGKFEDVSAASGACPPAFRGRSACVLDIDGDGLPDLLLGEGVYYGSPRRCRLMRNKGGLRFEDVSDAAGLPAGAPGLGVAAGDVNGDGWPDLFLAGPAGGNRLLVNDGRGGFREPPGSRKTFAWTLPGKEDMPCGACFGDVDGDGRPDLAIGQHFERPWLAPEPVRLYLNRSAGGDVRFEDVTAAAGLTGLPLKGPHVEIQDFDNDGRADLYVSIVTFAGGRVHPVIFRNEGVRDGVPRFRERALGVNDFPTAADRAEKRTGKFFEKMIAEKKILFTAPGPSADYDRDGRLDLFLPSWWPEAPSLLLRNETAGGRWLRVTVAGGEGVNRDGIGAAVRLYESGRLGEAGALAGFREIAAGYGYSSGQEPVAHFGLGARERVDVEVTLPHGKGKIVRRGVKADQRIRIGLQ